MSIIHSYFQSGLSLPVKRSLALTEYCKSRQKFLYFDQKLDI